jgi:hypothetical protein
MTYDTFRRQVGEIAIEAHDLARRLASISLEASRLAAQVEQIKRELETSEGLVIEEGASDGNMPGEDGG